MKNMPPVTSHPESQPEMSGKKSQPAQVSKSAADQPQTGGKWVVWLMAVVCLMVGMPAMLVELQRPQVVSTEEARIVATSVETWRHYRQSMATGSASVGDTVEVTNGKDSPGGITTLSNLIVPHLNDRLQLEHPPAVVWAHLIAFAMSNHAQLASVDQLVTYARLTSIIFALITVGAIFWAGFSIGRTTTAVLAALICATNPFFIFSARLATTTIQQTALVTLAMAAAFWAIRPLRPTPSVERQFVGWVTCGLAMGFAMLTAGLWSAFYVAVPIVLIMVLCPGRISHLMGLLASFLISLLIVVPWVVIADSNDPMIHRHWFSVFANSDWKNVPQLAGLMGQHGLILLVTMLPWTLWIVSAIIQPFSTSSSGSRVRMVIVWMWVLGCLVVVGLNPAEYRLADHLILVPPTSLLVGQLFDRYTSLAAQGRFARFWRWLRWPQLVLLGIFTAAVPVFIHLQPVLVSHGWIPSMMSGQPQWYFGVGLAIVLLAILLLSLRWTIKQYPSRSLICWIGWLVVLVGVSAILMARGPASINPMRTDAQTLATLATDQNIYWLTDTAGASQPDSAVLLYSNRTLPIINPVQLSQLLTEPQPFYLIAGDLVELENSKLHVVTQLETLSAKVWEFTEIPLSEAK